MKKYLAIDIGASSGRHIVGWMEDGKIQTKEIYRFPNGVTTIKTIKRMFSPIRRRRGCLERITMKSPKA